MTRFRGEYNYSVDAKGRFNVPAKFRKALSPDANETFVISRAPDNCLRAYPEDSWKIYEDELYSRPQTQETLRFQRKLASMRVTSKLDSQGRISLTPKQMAIAKISKDVILVGNLGYIEIWDTKVYDTYLGSDDDFDDLFFQSVESGMRS